MAEGEGRNRSYSEEEVIAGLEAWIFTGKFTLASDKTGIPTRTIVEWSHNPKYSDLIAGLRLAHARAAQVHFAAVAEANVDAINMSRGVLLKRLSEIANGPARKIDGREVAAILSSLSGAAMNMARVGGLAGDGAEGGSDGRTLIIAVEGEPLPEPEGEPKP